MVSDVAVRVFIVSSFAAHQKRSIRVPKCTFQFRQLKLCQLVFTKGAHLVRECSEGVEKVNNAA